MRVDVRVRQAAAGAVGDTVDGVLLDSFSHDKAAISAATSGVGPSKSRLPELFVP